MKTLSVLHYINQYKIFILHWLIQPIVSFFYAFFALLLTVIALFLLWKHVPQKNKLFYILFAISLSIATYTLHKEIRREAQWQKCFEFNVAYPGIKAFDECEKNVTWRDYHFAFKR